LFKYNDLILRIRKMGKNKISLDKILNTNGIEPGFLSGLLGKGYRSLSVRFPAFLADVAKATWRLARVVSCF
jgi:hypothetical protein